MKSVTTFFSEVKAELIKVVWPKKDEVIKLTLIVLIISAVVAIYVGVWDFGFTKGLEWLVSNK